MRWVITAVAFAAMTSAGFAQNVETRPTPPPPAPPEATAESLLPVLVQHSRHVARLENGRITGEGGDFLRALGAQSQFVMFGEEHGNQAIADFIGAYWRDLRDIGFNYAAVEADPWSTGAMERELRAGGVERWRQYLQDHGGAAGIEFFSWDSEARLAQTIVDTTPRGREPTIWGLDQVFLGAVSPLLRQLAETARDPRARTLAAALAEESAPSFDWIGRNDTAVARLTELRSYLNGRRDRANAELVDAMLLTQRLYRPQMTNDGGDPFFSNNDREALMKATFIARYRAAERADGAPPRVMVKLGGYHIMRGATPTHVQGTGGFLTELATANGDTALAISIMCGPGGHVGAFEGEPAACDGPFREAYPFLADYIEPHAITIFDLRVWRLRPRRWQHLDAEMQRFIDSYDVIVVTTDGAAAQFLPGLTLPSRSAN